MTTPVLTTERIIFTCFCAADAAGFYAMNATPEVLQFTGDLPFAAVADARKFIEQYDHYQRYGYGRWTIRHRDGTYLGFCGLKYHPDTDEVDLGYRLAREQWGRGYATEAARACLMYGHQKLQLPRIIGRVAEENKASIRVLEKIGMRFFAPFDFDGMSGLMYESDVFM